MPDEVASRPNLLQRLGRRYAIGLAAFLIAAMLFCVSIFQIEKRRSSAKRLPQSIEEYREALHQADFGMYFLDFSQALSTPNNELTLENTKHYLEELVGLRNSNLGSTKNIGNLVANYSAVAGKRISFGTSWLKVTNHISYDDSIPRTRGETLDLIESILRANGGFIFPLNRTNAVLLTEQDLRDLKQPVPDRL